MVDKTIGALTAGSALDGTEKLEIEQGAASKRTTAQDIADLAFTGSSLAGLPAAAALDGTELFYVIDTNGADAKLTLDNFKFPNPVPMASAGFGGGVRLAYTGSGAFYRLERGDGASNTAAFQWNNNNSIIQFLGHVGIKPYTMTLANGLNSNISTSLGPATTQASVGRIAGPTGAFSLGGFEISGSLDDGRLLEIYNPTSQTMTIVNESASSTAAHRIKTLTGADVVLRSTAPSFATFRYFDADARWVLMSTN